MVLLLVAQAIQAVIFLVILWKIEQGRHRLIDALIARTPAEYSMLRATDKKPAKANPKEKAPPLYDDAYEAALASMREKAAADRIEGYLEQGYMREES